MTKRTILAGSNAEQQIKSLVKFYGYEEVLRVLQATQDERAELKALLERSAVLLANTSHLKIHD